MPSLLLLNMRRNPLYCAHCKMLGHTLQSCKKVSSMNAHDGTDKIKVTKRHQTNNPQTDFAVPRGNVVKQSELGQKEDVFIISKSDQVVNKESDATLSNSDCF